MDLTWQGRGGTGKELLSGTWNRTELSSPSEAEAEAEAERMNPEPD